MLVTGSWGRSFFIGFTTTRDAAVVAALYLNSLKVHDEFLNGCALGADGITFRQNAARENFAWTTSAVKTCGRFVLSFTMSDKALQLKIGNDRTLAMPCEHSPPFMNYPVVVCVPGSLYYLPRVDPCLCDSF